MYLVVNWLAQDFAATQINLKKNELIILKLPIYIYINLVTQYNVDKVDIDNIDNNI